jgi:hypothetical protein
VKNEEESIHRGADRLSVQAGGTGHYGDRDLQETEDCGADALSLAKLQTDCVFVDYGFGIALSE